MSKILEIENCLTCPNCSTERVIGYKRKCKEKNIDIQYVENPNEAPRPIPEWCPLKEKK